MNNHKLLKIAGVLLLSAVMLISASAVTANTGITKKDYVFNNTLTNPSPNTMGSRTEYLNESWSAGIPVTWTQQQVAQTYSWDKYYGGWDWGSGAVPPAPHTTPWNVMFEPTIGPEGAITKLITPAMDLSTASNPQVSFWYAMHVDVTVQPAHTGQEIIDVFYKTSSAGSWVAVPGGHFGSDTPVWTKATLTLPSPSATYYIAFQGEYHWGYGACLDDVVVASGGADTTPPVTTCSLNGTMSGGIYTSDVKVTLTATDDSSGVNHTYYKLDSGALTTYTAPFMVTADGAHTLIYYSVDKAGNKEDNQTKAFTIAHPVTILITIKGGFGVSAVVKNNGTTALTNISWSITLDGKLIFVGKTKSGTISTLASGDETTIKIPLVLGFGKTNIDVEVGTASKTAAGTVILFFVIGVA